VFHSRLSMQFTSLKPPHCGSSLDHVASLHMVRVDFMRVNFMRVNFMRVIF